MGGGLYNVLFFSAQNTEYAICDLHIIYIQRENIRTNKFIINVFALNVLSWL